MDKKGSVLCYAFLLTEVETQFFLLPLPGNTLNPFAKAPWSLTMSLRRNRNKRLLPGWNSGRAGPRNNCLCSLLRSIGLGKCGGVPMEKWGFQYMLSSQIRRSTRCYCSFRLPWASYSSQGESPKWSRNYEVHTWKHFDTCSWSFRFRCLLGGPLHCHVISGRNPTITNHQRFF